MRAAKGRPISYDLSKYMGAMVGSFFLIASKYISRSEYFFISGTLYFLRRSPRIMVTGIFLSGVVVGIMYIFPSTVASL